MRKTKVLVQNHSKRGVGIYHLALPLNSDIAQREILERDLYESRNLEHTYDYTHYWTDGKTAIFRINPTEFPMIERRIIDKALDDAIISL